MSEAGELVHRAAGQPPSLKGRVALITGASRGIGRAIAQRLASAGATVVLTARSANRVAGAVRDGQPVILPGTLEETAALIEGAGGRALVIPCDIEAASERAGLVAEAVAAAGRLDILVNNAGFADYAPVATMPDEVYFRTVEHYLTTPFVLCRAAIPVLKAQGQGWILNIGSASAQKPVRPYMDADIAGGMTVYAAVKAALARFTQGLAAELLDCNIAVNLVAPSGAIRTPGASGYIPDWFEGEPIEYIAAVALDLVHEPASTKTGLVTHSLHYAEHSGLAVTTLDGKLLLPPPPARQWSHPEINPTGL
jgi:NAD(P)-dependent dehydrogenase (short-subunit alcohol dehydrogenase family)